MTIFNDSIFPSFYSAFAYVQLYRALYSNSTPTFNRLDTIPDSMADGRTDRLR